MMVRRFCLIVAVVAASLGWAGVAKAGPPTGNAYENGSTLYYLANPGQANDLVIRLTIDGYTIDDVVDIVTGVNCTHPGADLTFVVCLAPGITTVWVEAGDMNDFVDIRTNTHTAVRAGPGDDSVWGYNGTDSLFGEAGNDYLNGWGGDDWITGGIGTDIVYGGSGSWDVVSYFDSPVGVTVDLDGVADDGAPGENDTIGADLEVLHGSKFNDVLAGNAGSNHIHGLAGDDYLYGLGGNDYLYGDGFSDYVIGADHFYGGTGIDTVSYTDHNASQPVGADLDGATGDDGYSGEGDTIAGDVENLGGSYGADWLVGNNNANTIDGGAGGDLIGGLGGNDNLYGRDGNDYIYGGDGDDLITGNEGDDNLYGQNNADTINGGTGTDTCDLGAGGSVTSQCP